MEAVNTLLVKVALAGPGVEISLALEEACTAGVCAVTAGHLKRGWMGKQSSSPELTLALAKRLPETWQEEVLLSTYVCVYMCLYA